MNCVSSRLPLLPAARNAFPNLPPCPLSQIPTQRSIHSLLVVVVHELQHQLNAGHILIPLELVLVAPPSLLPPVHLLA